MKYDKIQPHIIEMVRDISNDKIELILSELGVNIDNTFGSNYEIRTCCPVHRGDNQTAFCYNKKYKLWKCYTKNCSEDNASIFGLVQKILSISFIDSIKWLAEKLEIDIDGEDLVIDDDSLEISRIIREYNPTGDTNQSKETFEQFPVKDIVGKVKPSQYFLDQGFSIDILKKYNVGYCDNPYKPMYLRSYIPVLDDHGEMVVGVTGRIIYEKCEFCSYYHEPNKGCPHENSKVKNHPKWKHFGFNSSNVLYNYWFSKDFIKNSKTVILAEGPKDILWLEQHSIKNSVSLFGLTLSKNHLKKLINIGVTSVIIGLDNDKAGNAGISKLNQMLSPYFKIHYIDKFLGENEDIADIKSDILNNEFKNFVNKINNE